MHVHPHARTARKVTVLLSAIFNGMPAGDIPGATWRKSRHSGAQGNCVEVAELPSGEVAVRNSKDPNGPALVYTRAEIEAFVAGAKDGEFDLAPDLPTSPAEAARDGIAGLGLIDDVRVFGKSGEPSPARTASHYQVVGDELQTITDSLLAGDAVLDRAEAEELVRVLGAVWSLHRRHRVDSRGRCSICRVRSRWWSPWSKKNVCTVYSALDVHLGRSLAPTASFAS